MMDSFYKISAFVLIFMVGTEDLFGGMCEGQTVSFDLTSYDQAYDVLQLSVIALTAVYREVIPVDSTREITKRDIILSRPASKPRFYEAKAFVIKSYKRRYEMGDTIILRTSAGGSSSCGHIPRSGLKMLFYAGNPVRDNHHNAHGISSCSRVKYFDNEFKNEVTELSILERLSENISDPIKGEELLGHFDALEEWESFRGGYSNGYRDGIWEFYIPKLGYWPNKNNAYLDKMVKEKFVVLRVQYDAGKVVKVEREILGIKNVDYYTKRWQNYFTEQI